MKQEEIEKMFEGRWRIKGFDDYEVRQLSGKAVKDLCRDFFQAGILLTEHPATVPEGSFEGICEVHTSRILPDGSGTPWQNVDPFEYWWNLYDKKCGRKDCLKKWQRLTELEKSECIAATPAYVHSTPDKQFRKNPLSYLNQKAWNDEIINRNENSTNNNRDKLAALLTP